MQKSTVISLSTLLLSLIMGGCAASAQTFEIDTEKPRIAGDPVDIVVSGLSPGEEVVLHARRVLKNHFARGAPSQVFSSSARFLVDKDGRVDTSESAAIEGSYEGVDPNGLFWSMRPETDGAVEAHSSVELEVKIDGETVASSAFDLIGGPGGLEIRDVPSLPGSYFAAHPDAGDHPVIIMVGGADDLRFNRETVVPQLVAQGYSVLYFATYEIIYGTAEPTVEELPTRYVNIPIDRLQGAYDWLVEQPNVDEHRIGLYGYSRNAAYVLLAATRFDWIDAVAAIAPSDVVWEGWGEGVPLGTTSSYSWQDEPLTYVAYGESWFRETAKFGRGERGRLRTPMDEGRWTNPQSVVAARIPIETYRGALLVSGGEQDDLWSAGHMAQNIAERRAESGLVTELLVFPDAGHTLIGDGQSPILLIYEPEEARAVTAKAQSETWQATLDLFRNALQRPGNQ
ncbi:MAG: acyl-CoA thioesterase/BAAT N-terminal domain-containing protein [Pseudomonadota bacterium]